MLNIPQEDQAILDAHIRACHQLGSGEAMANVLKEIFSSMGRYALRDDRWERIKNLLPGREGYVGGTA